MKRFLTTYFKQHNRFAIFCAFLGSSLIAMSPLFVRFSEIGVTSTAFFRFFFALPVIWVWMIFDQTKPSRQRNPDSIRDYLWLAASGVFLSLDILLWYLSMQHTSIVNSILLNNGCTVIVAILAWLLFKEKLTWQTVAGIILAVMGSSLLVGESFKLGEPEHITGDIYGLLSAVFYAFFILVTKKLRSQFSTPTIMMWSGFSAVYVLGIIAFLSGETVIPVTPNGWYIVLGLSFIVHILGQGLMSYSMAHLTATFSALITLVGPVIGAIIGFTFFQEYLSSMQVLGGTIIIMGIVLSRYNKKKYKN